MATFTTETAVAQLKACRDDFQALVRARRAAAKADLTEATRMAGIIKVADADAVTFLQALLADAATPAALKSCINQQLAFHSQVKKDQATEDAATATA